MMPVDRLAWLMAIASSDLPKRALQVATVLAWHCNKDTGDVRTGGATVGRSCNIGERAAWRAIKDLTEAGWLVVDQTWQGKCALRKLTYPQDWKSLANRPVADCDTPGNLTSGQSASLAEQPLAKDEVSTGQIARPPLAIRVATPGQIATRTGTEQGHEQGLEHGRNARTCARDFVDEEDLFPPTDRQSLLEQRQPPVTERKPTDEEKWRMQVAMEPWAQAIKRAGGKIGPGNWVQFDEMVKRFELEPVLKATKATPAASRWPDAIEETIQRTDQSAVARSNGRKVVIFPHQGPRSKPLEIRRITT